MAATTFARLSFVCMVVVIAAVIMKSFGPREFSTQTKSYLAYPPIFPRRESALRACTNGGGELATIRSEGDLNELRLSVRSLAYPFAVSPKVWIGLELTLYGETVALTWSNGDPSYFMSHRLEIPRMPSSRPFAKRQHLCALYSVDWLGYDAFQWVPCNGDFDAGHVCEQSLASRGSRDNADILLRSPHAAYGYSATGKVERTFLMIQPHAVLTGHAPAIANELRSVFGSIQVKSIVARRDRLEAFFASRNFEHLTTGTESFSRLVDQYNGHTIVCVIIEARDAVRRVQDAAGRYESPLSCAEHTLRRRYGVDAVQNAVYASPSADQAAKDIQLWFSEGVFDHIQERWSNFVSSVQERLRFLMAQVLRVVTDRRPIAAVLLVLWLYFWHSQVRRQHLLDYLFRTATTARIDQFDSAVDEGTTHGSPQPSRFRTGSSLWERVRSYFHDKRPRRSDIDLVQPEHEDDENYEVYPIPELHESSSDYDRRRSSSEPASSRTFVDREPHQRRRNDHSRDSPR